MRENVLRFLKKEIQLDHIPGAVIQVAHQGEVILEEAVGSRSILPEKLPMEVGTVFDLASLTKVVATLPAVLRLIDTGDIRLDDEVNRFLPQFFGHGKEAITIRHLLTHTSGLRAQQRFSSDELAADEILSQLYTDEREAQVGDQVIYSDFGSIALYRIVETVTGEEFSQFVQKHIFDPLDMTETMYNPTFPVTHYAATEFSQSVNDYKRGIVHDENTEAMGGISGHAGLFSTVHDLGKFAEMIENNGVYQGRRVLSSVGLHKSRENYTPHDLEYRGLGWILKSPAFSSCGDYFSSLSYGHTGFTGTSIWFDPEAELRVILLTNRVHYGRQDHIVRIRPLIHNIIRGYF